MAEHLLHKQLGCPFGCDGFTTGYKLDSFGAAMIGDGEDGIIPLREREFSDEIDGDHFEGLSLRHRINRL